MTLDLPSRPARGDVLAPVRPRRSRPRQSGQVRDRRTLQRCTPAPGSALVTSLFPPSLLMSSMGAKNPANNVPGGCTKRRLHVLPVFFLLRAPYPEFMRPKVSIIDSPNQLFIFCCGNRGIFQLPIIRKGLRIFRVLPAGNQSVSSLFVAMKPPLTRTMAILIHLDQDGNRFMHYISSVCSWSILQSK